MDSDLGVKKALAELDETSETSADWKEIAMNCSPWRSYLTHLLWAHHARSTTN